ncbi:39927_t:CDS:10, partial [Gigaspora margarita]
MTWKKKKRGGNKKNRQDAPRERDNTKSHFNDIVRENEAFEKYYKVQNIIPETEWERFMEVNKTTLPTSFRITGSRSNAFELRKVLVNVHVPELNKIQFGDDNKSEAPRSLPWYPDELGWQHSAPRSTIKKSPAFQNFHKWLVAETEVGNISRQEAVSMIPPLLLDVKPGHWVLDMCAAPGSKTVQIIEAVHANDLQDKTIPSGLVIANDADLKRSCMLVHQAKRLKSPCLIVTNHDAAQFPGVYVKQGLTEEKKPIQFDRILADVPCSGDGTLRKNFLIWKNWGIGSAIGLHYTQVKILLRGAQLAKESGRIVYSTCSMNPLENEAVVAEVLRRSRGNLQLVDVSDQLPQLIRAPGVTTWKVMSKENKWVDKLEDIDPKYQKKYAKSLWPPADVGQLNLERCMRIYPHFQDTGAFFIAVFQKTGPITDISSIDDSVSNKNACDTEDASVAETNENDIQTFYEETDMSNDPDATIVDDLSTNDAADNFCVVPIKRHNVDSSKHESHKCPKVEKLETKVEPDEEDDNQMGSQKRACEEPFIKLETKVENDYNQMGSQKRACEEPIIKLEIKVEPDEDNSQMGSQKQMCEEPFIFLDPDEYYGLSHEFPTDQLLVRSVNERNKILYFVSEPVKRVLQAPDCSRLRVVNSGIKVFTRQEANEPIKCEFRFNAEGIIMIYPYVSKNRVVNFSLDDLKILLSEPTPLIDRFDEKIQKRLKELDMGCIIIYIDPCKERDA